MFYDDSPIDGPGPAEIAEAKAYRESMRFYRDPAERPEPPEDFVVIDGFVLEEPISAEEEETFPVDWEKEGI